MLIAAQLPLRAGLRAIEKTKFIFIAYVATAVFSLVSARFFVIEHSVSGIMLGILIVEAMMLLIFFCGVVLRAVSSTISVAGCITSSKGR